MKLVAVVCRAAYGIGRQPCLLEPAVPDLDVVPVH